MLSYQHKGSKRSRKQSSRKSSRRRSKRNSKRNTRRNTRKKRRTSGKKIRKMKGGAVCEWSKTKPATYNWNCVGINDKNIEMEIMVGDSHIQICASCANKKENLKRQK